MCFSHFTVEDKLHLNCTLAVKDNLLHPQNWDLCLSDLSGKFFPEPSECSDCERTWIVCATSEFWANSSLMSLRKAEKKKPANPKYTWLMVYSGKKNLLEPFRQLRHDTELLSFLMKAFWTCQELFICLVGDDSGCETEAWEYTRIGYELSFPPFSKILPGYCWVSVCRTLSKDCAYTHRAKFVSSQIEALLFRG